MNYSYVMGIRDIEVLKQNHFEVKQFGHHYGIIFSDDQIEFYEKFICEQLQNGFWNEYLGKKIVFLFKFQDGTVKRFVFNDKNEQEILRLCCEFAGVEFSSILDMLQENEFYRNLYFQQNED